MELSRKDDLMSVGYLIVYMFNGQLPWSNVSTCDGRADYAKTLQAKRNTRIEQLCSGLPKGVAEFLLYCYLSCKFAETPNYDLLRKKVLDSLPKADRGSATFDWS
mmetsp:Transcript_9789/g.30384  ORF Transcript_9789/g.30384 Transcript_9789/m.30384 type:complete len:105 (+) Transcript_9789:539-853(+)